MTLTIVRFRRRRGVIKSARAQFYSCKAGSPDFRLPTVIEAKDLRLMRAAMRALKKIANTPSPECARDPFLCKALARQALDAFNKGARK